MTPGNQTTEYAVTQSTGILSILTALAGFVLAIAPQVSVMFAASPGVVSAAGVALAIAGVVTKSINTTAYTAARAQVKSAAGQAKTENSQ